MNHSFSQMPGLFNPSSYVEVVETELAGLVRLVSPKTPKKASVVSSGIRARACHKECQCCGRRLIECIILLFCGGFKLQRRQRYIAFWSYTRFDDKHDGNWLTGLKDALTAEVQALRGVSVEIFQDVEGIGWGERWESRIKLAEDDALFLIPIVTPSYFNSEPCREELEQFVDREKRVGFDGLILPLYYIECPQLKDKFKRGADSLAKIVAAHNYKDIRKYRRKNLESDEVRQIINELATELIDRLDAFARWELNSKRMQASVTAPSSRIHLPRRPVLFGTLQEVPSSVEIWMVVEIGSSYHPQAHLPRNSITWHAAASLGREGFDENCEFRVHLLAVTEDVSVFFDRYRKDAGKLGKWRGVSKPTDSRILYTLTVVRDDSRSPFSLMEGDYEELSDGKPTGGVIRVKLKGQDILETEARNSSGKTVWTGNIKMDISRNPPNGRGTYSYSGKPDSGQHQLTIDATSGDLIIVGKNTSATDGKTFQTIWKRKM